MLCAEHFLQMFSLLNRLWLLWGGLCCGAIFGCAQELFPALCLEIILTVLSGDLTVPGIENGLPI